MRYHGAKFRLAPWLLKLFPPHVQYVETHGGAAGVLLNKERSYSEVYNDVDGEIVNFFRVLQDPEKRGRLIELCVLTPYSRAEFDIAWEPSEDPVERARRTAIRAQMGFGSAGATKGRTGFRQDSKREYATAAHLWATYPEALRRVGERFVGVLIDNKPASFVIAAHDHVDTLFYVDPPYVLSTRNLTRGSHYYRHEMTDEDHRELLNQLKQVTGMVVLSGYRNPIYDEELDGWERVETRSRISAGRGTTMRTEVVWMNQACSARRQEVQRALA